MVTNTPIGVFRAIVILPSCLDFTVVHRLLRQASTCRDHGRNEPDDCGLCLDDELTGSCVFTFSGRLRRRCPEVGFEEISDLPEAHLWITSGLPTTRPRSLHLLRGAGRRL